MNILFTRTRSRSKQNAWYWILYSSLVRNNWSTWWWNKERPKHVVVPTIRYVNKNTWTTRQFKFVFDITGSVFIILCVGCTDRKLVVSNFRYSFVCLLFVVLVSVHYWLCFLVTFLIIVKDLVRKRNALILHCIFPS